MNKEKLIITLISQDMKHNQLVLGLQQLGFIGNDYHTLKIYDITAELMGLKSGTITDKWSDIYINYMKKATRYGIEPSGKNLMPLAEECYEKLLECT